MMSAHPRLGHVFTDGSDSTEPTYSLDTAKLHLEERSRLRVMKSPLNRVRNPPEPRVVQPYCADLTHPTRRIVS